jgi:hypothetical protein
MGLFYPLPNLDPSKNLKFGSHDLVICHKCLTLYGRLVHILPESADGKRRSGWRYQKCRCMKKEDDKNKTKIRLWPGHDFNTTVEFCHCCSKELINTGSKFSSFYCNDCRELVIRYNKQTEKMSIPLGRHSFMNDIKLTFPYSDEEGRQFDNDLKYFFKKVDLMWDWQRLCLFHNLHDLGFRFGNDISIHLYDKMLPNLENDKAGLIQQMVNFLSDGMRDDYLKTVGSFSNSNTK